MLFMACLTSILGHFKQIHLYLCSQVKIGIKSFCFWRSVRPNMTANWWTWIGPWILLSLSKTSWQSASFGNTAFARLIIARLRRSLSSTAETGVLIRTDVFRLIVMLGYDWYKLNGHGRLGGTIYRPPGSAEAFRSVVNSKLDDELTDVASERRAISAVVTRKKKKATDVIANVVKGIFP